MWDARYDSSSRAAKIIIIKQMKRLLTSIAVLGILMPGAAQQTKILTADKHNEYGLVYTLPNTALRIDVTATRTVRQAGPYWQYSKKYIGTDRVIREDSEEWRIIDVTVIPYGVADTETQYLMQLKPGALTYLAVGDDNMLLAINKEVSEPEKEPVYNGEVGSSSLPRMDAYLQYVDGDFISSQSSAKRAEMLASSLMDVRDAKVSLSRGTADTMPTDGRQLELMLQSLRNQEKAFTAAFAGLTATDTITRTYTFIPGEEGKTMLFRMSDFAGFCASDDFSGDPVTVTVSDVRRGEIPVTGAGEEKKLPRDAVMYRVPGRARVTIALKGETLWSDESEYGQYGVTFGLDPKLFTDRKSRSYATFNTATGGLKELGQVEE